MESAALSEMLAYFPLVHRKLSSFPTSGGGGQLPKQKTLTSKGGDGEGVAAKTRHRHMAMGYGHKDGIIGLTTFLAVFFWPLLAKFITFDTIADTTFGPLLDPFGNLCQF